MIPVIEGQIWKQVLPGGESIFRISSVNEEHGWVQVSIFDESKNQFTHPAPYSRMTFETISSGGRSGKYLWILLTDEEAAAYEVHCT